MYTKEQRKFLDDIAEPIRKMRAIFESHGLKLEFRISQLPLKTPVLKIIPKLKIVDLNGSDDDDNDPSAA